MPPSPRHLLLAGALLLAWCACPLASSASLSASPSPLSAPRHHQRHLLADPPANEAASPIAQLQVRRRKATASSQSVTSLDLLEADVLAAGGQSLSQSAIPCAFTFHEYPMTTEVAIGQETSYDESATFSEMHNTLEWLHGVALSYRLNVMFAAFPLVNAKQTYSETHLWQRFLGLHEGEFNLDDLNQRHGETTMAIQTVDGYPTPDSIVQLVADDWQKAGQTRETSPARLYWVRSMQTLDSDVVCQHERMVRALRQKYCAARAFRPVPIALYDQLRMPTAKHHPIHIAVQLHSTIVPGQGGGDATTIPAHLPAHFDEYLASTSLVIAQTLATLRRHTRAALHVHLFSDPPLTADEKAHHLRRLEHHPLIRQVIASDVAADAANEGMALHSHLTLSALHAFHHLVTSDVLIAGWNARALLAVALSEGVVLAPRLPKFVQATKVGGKMIAPEFFDLPRCSERTGSYSARQLATEQADKQLADIEAFFAADTPPPADASAPDGGVSPTPSSRLLASKFELPMRRMVRRRHAEALVLRTFWDEPKTTAFRPNALLMRHCQAIPEPKFEPNTPPTAAAAPAPAAAATK